jgi:hypothetical protein
MTGQIARKAKKVDRTGKKRRAHGSPKGGSRSLGRGDEI